MIEPGPGVSTLSGASTSWAEGMPNNNGGKQDYMVTNFDGKAGEWDDDDEEQRRGFICQYRREFTQ